MKKKFKSVIAGLLAAIMTVGSFTLPTTVSAYTVEHPTVPENVSVAEWGRMEWEGDGGYTPLDFEPLFDYPIRDTYIEYVPETALQGGDYYYMVGTTGAPTWFYDTEGVRMWRSKDMESWEDLGIVWSIKDSKWATEGDGVAACWAPEVHYIEKYENYYMTYSTNEGGIGILKSTTGKPEGPYVEMSDNRVVGEVAIDGSFFEEDDGRLYFLWQDGRIAEISLMDENGNDEVRFLSETVRLGVPASTSETSKNNPDQYDYEHVGFEGVYVFKMDGKYYLSCAEFNLNSDDLVAAEVRNLQDTGGNVPDLNQLTYDCMVAVSDNLMGPYENWHLAVRSGGHNNFFFDRDGQLWSTFFGSYGGTWDYYTPLETQPGALKMELTEDGRLQPLWEDKEINLAQMDGVTAESTVYPGDPVKYAVEKAFDGKLNTRWAASTFGVSQTMTVDLGKECVLSGTRIYFEIARLKYKYLIETSLDGSTWTTYADRTNNTTEDGAPIDRGNGYEKARYVRLTVNGHNGDPFLASICEFQIYGWEYQEDFDIAIHIEECENGTIVSDAEDGIAIKGSDVIFTFKPDAGYKVDKVYVNGEPVSLNASKQYVAKNVQEALIIKAEFVEESPQPEPGTATEPVYNPIAPAVTSEGTADPSAVYYEGNYYYVKMRNSSEIVIYKSPDLFSTPTGECRVVFSTAQATAAGMLPVTLWAPEIQYVEKTDKYYIYFTAEESGKGHKMYVLEGGSSPDDPYVYKGMMGGQTSDWQIDGSIIEKRNNIDDPSDNQLYFVTSIIQRSDELGGVQDLGIYEMTDPCNYVEGSLKILCRPEYDWERQGTPDSILSVNEGPQVLARNGKIFVVYSASTCWSRHYKLGMLYIDDTLDFMDMNNWVKLDEPVFQESAENSAYGVGHHCMVYNYDTDTDYIIYHGYDVPPASRAYATQKRDVRMQEFTWNEDGTPNFGVPTDYTTPIAYSTLQEFTDNFDSASFDDKWISYGGEWKLEDGKAVSDDMVLGSKLLLKDAMIADFTLEADVTASNIANEGVGILFRTTLAYPAPDAQCGYYFGLNEATGMAVLGKFSDNWKVMSRVPFAVKEDQTYHVKVVCNGSNITVYVDDMETPVLKARDTDYRQGSVGIRAYGADVSVDNFTVISQPYDESQAQTAFEVGGIYKFINYNSGKVIGVANNGTANGSNVEQQTDKESPFQQWKVLEGTDGWYKLENAGNGKLLAIAGSSTANTANVHVWEDDGTAGELWQIDENGDGTFKLIAQCSGKVIDVLDYSKEDGANLIQYNDNVSTNQRFMMVRVAEDEASYTNPIAVDQEYPDPYIYYHELDGYYYGMATNIAADGSSTKLYLYRSRNMADVFGSSDKKLIAEPAPGHDIWAPEIHYIDGAWYVYYSGGMRGHVLANTSADPMEGAWEYKGEIYAEGLKDETQIDGTILRQNDKLYYVWCLWKQPEKDTSDTVKRQTVVISEMENPWTLKGDIAVLSESEYDWEQMSSAGDSDIEYKTNEGPGVLQYGGKTFITYSGSYCHTQYYSVGLLTCDSTADPMDPANWTKSPEPVFTRNVENGLWSTGHNSFTTTPDGEEVYLVYHMSLTNQNDDRRYPALQKIDFDENGMPVFGTPEGRYNLLTKPVSAEENDFEVNLALGKEATASTIFNGDYDAAKAVDGAEGTRWAAINADMPQTLTVDLGEEYFINYIKILFERESLYQFKLEYSSDNETWNTFADYSDNTENLLTEKIEGAAIGRYVRISFTNATHMVDGIVWYDFASIWEFEVYGGKVPAYEVLELSGMVYETIELPETFTLEFDGMIEKEFPVTWESATVMYDAEGEYKVSGEIDGLGLPVEANITIEKKDLTSNIALNKPMSASTTFNNSYSAAMAADGNDSTRWAANGASMPQWLSVDLGDIYCITGINTVFEMNCKYQYIIETSMDNQTWTTYADHSTNSQSISESLDENIAFGRYARIRILGAETNWASIWEFEVYGGKVISVEDINIEGSIGEEITLPEKVDAVFMGGTSKEIPVAWENSMVVYEQPGKYEVVGNITDELTITANIKIAETDAYDISGTVACETPNVSLEGIVVELYRVLGDTVSDEPIASVQTGKDGAYRFENIAPGSLVVKVASTEQYLEVTSEVTLADQDVVVPVMTLVVKSEPPVQDMPYVDVTADDWFYDAVYYNYIAKTMTGMDETHFGPYGQLSRAQFALILYRMEGEPAVDTDKKFHDISGEEWYGQAVLWAAENGIVTGYQNGNYGPVDLITREQMAVMMYRYANYLGEDTSEKADYSNFKDASSVSGFAADAMQWTTATKIITGKENGTLLDPQGNTARAEAATIIQRFMEK